MVSIFLECTHNATHYLKRAEQWFSRVFSTVWSLSHLFSRLSYGTEGNLFLLFTHSEFTFLHSVDQSNQIDFTSFALLSCRASSKLAKTIFHAQFGQAHLDFDFLLLLCSAFAQLNFHAFLVVFSFKTLTHTPTDEYRLCSFLWSWFFSSPLQSDFTL